MLVDGSIQSPDFLGTKLICESSYLKCVFLHSPKILKHSSVPPFMNISLLWFHFRFSNENQWAIMALPSSCPSVQSLCVCVSVCLVWFAWQCVCLCLRLWKWATEGRLSASSLPVDSPSVAVPGPDRGEGGVAGEKGGGGSWRGTDIKTTKSSGGDNPT